MCWNSHLKWMGRLKRYWALMVPNSWKNAIQASTLQIQFFGAKRNFFMESYNQVSINTFVVSSVKSLSIFVAVTYCYKFIHGECCFFSDFCKRWLTTVWFFHGCTVRRYGAQLAAITSPMQLPTATTPQVTFNLFTTGTRGKRRQATGDKLTVFRNDRHPPLPPPTPNQPQMSSVPRIGDEKTIMPPGGSNPRP